MANTTLCTDTSEATELYGPGHLYIKPIAKLNICVQLPQLKGPSGKAISNWEVMERIKHMITPETFITLKIVKSTLEFIRLEGEIENKGKIKLLIAKLDTKILKLSGFTEVLKMRAAEAKINFPSKHDWDSYFRDAKNMNEMKAGERPDCIHLKDLPTRWFASNSSSDKDKPSETTLRRVFEVFGEVRCVDIPMLDPYRREIIAATKPGGIQTFNYNQGLTFDCFVQYKEYISFMKAMDALRGMKLMFKDGDKALTANIKVDFDKTKHLTDKNIRKRRLEREKLEELERLREDKVRKEKEAEEKKEREERQKKEEEEREKERRRLDKIKIREARQREREEIRRRKKLEKKKREEEERMQLKIALEERKFLLAERKLQSIHLLSVLFDRVKVRI
ncbi:hypothetical protein LOTGIDRAFT_111325 [Lottia gigantea]|uniref:RRM domain-containing protein n=1 Tax=Lottia gigantea TaxID=225164 RepID=V4B8B2_LOTGI|nr:hypothetical protein LOTGIDRAFT_111325 [Lottia gigantea]ESP01947.1 hypothetical protein LOTGIDRAFT_111325 [Lottia gigantea]